MNTMNFSRQFWADGGAGRVGDIKVKCLQGTTTASPASPIRPVRSMVRFLLRILLRTRKAKDTQMTVTCKS